jgi:beta-phosphoglucomutase
MIGTEKILFPDKALIFDMDGTIVDNIPYHFQARLLFLQKHGLKLLPADAYGFGSSTKEFVKRHFGADLSLREIKALDDEKQSIYRELYKGNIKEIKGFTRLLFAAKNSGFKIALATMGCKKNIDLVLNSLHVKSCFDVIVSGEDISKGKPDPEIYLKTLSLLNISANNSLVFEDTQSGAQAAQQANIDVFGICSSHSEEEFISWGITECDKNYLSPKFINNRIVSLISSVIQ